LALTGEGKHVVTGGSDGILRLWDLDAGKELKQREAAKQSFVDLTFAPDNRQVVCVTSRYDPSTRTTSYQLALWRPFDDNHELTPVEGFEGRLCNAVFTPKGERLLAAGDRHLWIWYTESLKMPTRHTGLSDQVHALAFSSDAQRLLTAGGNFQTGGDFSVRLWDAGSGRELRRFQGHRGPVLAVTFSPDARRAYSTSTDGTLRVGGLPPQSCPLRPPAPLV